MKTKSAITNSPLPKASVKSPTKTTTEDNKVTFEYFAPEARTVQLAGTFNNWNASKADLKKDKSGRWKISLALSPGRYEYRYYVDGTWQNDQRPVACVRNPYGGLNCVIEVPQQTM